MTKPKAKPSAPKKSPAVKPTERRSLEETGSYEVLKTVSKEIEPVVAPPPDRAFIDLTNTRIADLEAKNEALKAWIRETVKLGQVNYATADAVLKA